MMPGVAPLLVGVLALAGCAASSGPGATRGAGGWAALAPFPLPPRQSALTAWTGSEALFLGGHPGPPCLDTGQADCEPPLRVGDGAAFDPVAGTWRRTADAPAPVHGGLSSAVSGDTVYVLDAEQLLAYDASVDAWTVHPPPDGAPGYARLAVADGQVVVVAGERRKGEPSGGVYDPSTRTWSPLPEDPLGPAFDRTVTATPAGLVLTGKTLVPDPGATEPAVVRAAVLDVTSSRWRLLEDSDMLGGWQWAWTGRRMVDPSLGVADGGEENGYGRDIPIGGTLDPSSGAWGRLPDAPEAGSGGWPVTAYGASLSAVSGWVYDDGPGSWTRLPRPGGAPPEPGPAVWAGERLVVLGGVDPARAGTPDVLSYGSWMWTP